MSDMRVTPPVRQALEPLEEAGYKLADSQVSGVGLVAYNVTVLQGPQDLYYLVHLPRNVLQSESGPSRRLVASLDRLFPPGSRLYLLSHGADAIELSLQSYVNAYDRVTATFVPWLHLSGTNDEVQPVGHLLIAFGLTEPPPSTPDRDAVPQRTTPVRATNTDELDLISASFTAYLEAIGEPDEAFRDVVRRLDLGQRSTNHATSLWTKDPSIAATKLTKWAAYQGTRVLGRFVALLIEEAPGRQEAPSLLVILRECCSGVEARTEELARRVEGARS
jgi:hypothetical protein